MIYIGRQIQQTPTVGLHVRSDITDLNLYYLNYFMHTCDKYTSTDMRYEQSEKYETYEVFLDILLKITTYFLFL